MVRYTRTLVICSLLAVATGALLGSRALPVPHGDGASLIAFVPGLVGFGALRSRRWHTSAPVDAPPAIEHPGDGNRHPRGPREARDAFDRPTR